VPYRWSFRQISTRWLARFVGSVNVSNSQPPGRLSRTVISTRCYVHNSEKVKSAIAHVCRDILKQGSPKRDVVAIAIYRILTIAERRAAE
jgi:hypothetical protein